MARIRIKFDKDFCGDETCNICFRDGDDLAKARDMSQLEKELQAYNEYKAGRANKPLPKPPVTLESIRCPRCGGGMVVRVNRNTQGEFLGCRMFPDCRGTRGIPVELKNKPKPVQPIAKPVVKPLTIELGPTAKIGVVTNLQKEVPPVKEVTFADLLSRPKSTTEEEQIKTSGGVDFGGEILGTPDKKKEQI